MKIFIEPLLAAFLFCVPSLVAQYPCGELDQKVELAIINRSKSTTDLLTELRKCETSKGVPGKQSRYEYHYAKYLLQSGKLKRADHAIRSALRIQKNPVTRIDLKILNLQSLIMNGKYRTALHLSNEIFRGPPLSDKQYAKLYSCLSVCHSALRNHIYSMNSRLKALYFSKRSGVAKYIATDYMGMGAILHDFGDKRSLYKSLYYSKKAMNMDLESDSAFQCDLLLNIVVVYLELRDYKHASYYLNKLYREYRNFMLLDGYSSIGRGLGSMYLLLGDYANATYFFNLELEAYKKKETKELDDIYVYFNIAELEYMKGNYRNSYNYIRTFFDLKQYFDRKLRNDKMIEMQERFNAQAREAKILKLKNRNQRAQLENYFLQTVLLVAGILVISGIILFVYVSRKRRRREDIRVKNEIKRAELVSVENEKLRVSRDLHDSVASSLAVIGLLISASKERNPGQEKEFEELYQLTQNTISDVRRLCRDLFPSEILIRGVLTSIGYLYELLKSANPSTSFDFTSDDMKLDQNFSVNLYRIVQELTANSLKYAEATQITTRISIENDNIHFFYADNGKGVDLKSLRKGVGLNSIEERTNAFKGKVKFYSEPGEGFSVTLIFPKEDILMAA